MSIEPDPRHGCRQGRELAGAGRALYVRFEGGQQGRKLVIAGVPDSA